MKCPGCGREKAVCCRLEPEPCPWRQRASVDADLFHAALEAHPAYRSAFDRRREEAA